MSSIPDEILVNLRDLENKLQESGLIHFSKNDRKLFWNIVGKIKRLEDPKVEYIEKAATIREILHNDRFGKPVDLKYILPTLMVSAIALIIGNLVYLNRNDDLLVAGLITYLGYTILYSVYFYVLDLIYINKFTTYSIISILSIIELFILYNYLSWILEFLVIFSIFGVVPVLYPHGRWISGKMTKIRIDGATKDIYFLITLKTNYKSYLSVPQNNRHWFFIIPGIGTALTATVIGIFEWIYYDYYIFLLLAVILIVAEIYAYLFDAGVWGGELGHARREKLIIKDIKKHKSQLISS